MKTSERLVQWVHRLLWSAPNWERCTKASCWSGSNAAVRHMNILSPLMSEGTFEERLAWAKQQGCNTIHPFFANQADGQYAGWSIYGVHRTPAWQVDEGVCELMRRRIRAARRRGLAVIPWLLADDSAQMNRVLLSDPARYAADLSDAGLFAFASAVVIGLELNEYASADQASALAAGVRRVYPGKLGIHQTSDREDYASIGDLFFAQTNPGKSADQIRALTRRFRATGKPVNFFELERHPARELCKAALDAGAWGVGNW